MVPRNSTVRYFFYRRNNCTHVSGEKLLEIRLTPFCGGERVTTWEALPSKGITTRFFLLPPHRFVQGTPERFRQRRFQDAAQPADNDRAVDATVTSAPSTSSAFSSCSFSPTPPPPSSPFPFPAFVRAQPTNGNVYVRRKIELLEPGRPHVQPLSHRRRGSLTVGERACLEERRRSPVDPPREMEHQEGGGGCGWSRCPATAAATTTAGTVIATAVAAVGAEEEAEAGRVGVRMAEEGRLAAMVMLLLPSRCAWVTATATGAAAAAVACPARDPNSDDVRSER